MINKILNFLGATVNWFYQPLRPVPFTAAMAYMINDDWGARLWGWKPLSSLVYQQPGLRAKFTHLDVNERIVEMPFILASLGSIMTKKNKTHLQILDVGCLESPLSLYLASLGHRVTGLDIRPQQFRHRNFKFVKADICQPLLPARSFDVVICLSTLEHIGLDTIYGEVESQKTSDTQAIAAMRHLLKTGGTLLLTTPVARKTALNNFMRTYTVAELQKKLSSFKRVSLQTFAADKKRSSWSAQAVRQLPIPPRFGVALIQALK